MKLKERIAFAMFGLLIFFVSGGIACSYGSTGVVDPILAVVLGVIVFFAAGAVACTYGSNRITKQKARQTKTEA
jgi:lipopolysaccharide export LptBFGC system permease protein LptF